MTIALLNERILNDEVYNTAYYTKLLMHFDGANGSTTFTDECGHVLTAQAGAVLSTAQFKFGTASGYFDRTGYVEMANSDDYDFGALPFTIEFWAYFIANNLGYQMIIDRRGSGDQTGFIVYLESNNTVSFIASNGSSYGFELRSSTVPTINAWHHISVNRDANGGRLYFNGSQISSNSGGSYAIGSISQNPYIGRNRIFPGGGFNGYLDELVIKRGKALRQSNFTPPTAPYS